MIKKYLSASPAQTRRLGGFLAKEILKSKTKKGFVVGLEGDLGGGKTTFVQGLAKGMGIKEKILSPTFIILKRFKTKGGMAKELYHIDCYRIKDSKEILQLGFKKIISYPKSVAVIEWADKIKKFLPKNHLVIKFKFINKNTREICLIQGKS